SARVLRELDRGTGGLGPGPAQVVGVEHGRAPVGAVAAGQQPRGRAPGVDRDRVHGLRVEVGTVVELPGATPPAPDEQALAGADGEQYLGHADHPRGVIPDAFARTRASLHPTTDSHLWIRRRGWSVRCAEPCGAGPGAARAARRQAPAGRARPRIASTGAEAGSVPKAWPQSPPSRGAQKASATAAGA